MSLHQLIAWSNNNIGYDPGQLQQQDKSNNNDIDNDRQLVKCLGTLCSCCGIFQTSTLIGITCLQTTNIELMCTFQRKLAGEGRGGERGIILHNKGANKEWGQTLHLHTTTFQFGWCGITRGHPGLITSMLLISAMSPRGMKQQNTVKRDMTNWSPGGLPSTGCCITTTWGCWA